MGVPITIHLSGGTDVPVTVDDQFLQLSPEEQAQTVQHIADQVDVSDSSALKYGASQALQGLGSTSHVAGDVLARHGMPDWAHSMQAAGDYLSNLMPAPKGYVPAGTSAAAALQQGNYLDAASYLPRMAVEGAPDTAAALGTAALGTGAAVVGGAPAAVGSGAATAAYLASRYLGQGAEARAANNGDQTPTDADVLESLPGTAAQVALGTVGLGRVGPGAALLAKTPALLRPVTAGLIDAAGTGAGDVAQQLGNTVGTAKGASVDPYEAAIAAAQGGAARATHVAATEAVPAAIREGTNQVMSRVVGVSDDPEQQRAVVDAHNVYRAALDGAPETGGNGKPVSPQQAMNNAKGTVQDYISRVIDHAKDQGWIDGSDVRTLRTLTDQAFRSNNTISGSGAGGSPSLLDRVSSMDLPEQTKTALVRGLRTLNTLAGQSFLNRAVGPFSYLGGLAGQIASVVGGGMEGGAGGVVGALIGHSMERKAGQIVGGMVDHAMGTNVPPVVWQAMAARRQLGRAGLDTMGPGVLEALTGAHEPLQQPSTLPGDVPQAPPAETGPWTAQGMTKSAWMAAQDRQEAAGRAMERQLIQQARAKAAAIQASQDRIQAAQVHTETLAQAEEARIAKENAAAAAKKEADYAAMKRLADAQRAAADASQPQWSAPNDKTAQEKQMWSSHDAAQNDTLRQAARANSGVTQSQVRGHMAEMTAKANAVKQFHALMTRRAAALAANAGREPGSSGVFAATGGEFGSPTGASDPLMVRADGTPITPAATPQRAVRASGAPRAATPAPQAPAAASGSPGVPVTHGGAPPAGARFGGGWMAYVQKALKDHGIDAHMGDIREAASHAAVNGALNHILGASDGSGQGVASQLSAIMNHGENGGHLSGPRGRAFMNAIGAQVAMNKGMVDRLAHPSGGAPGVAPDGMSFAPVQRGGAAPTAAPAAAPPGARAPIFDPERWNAVRADQQRYAANLAASVAHADPALSATIQHIAAEPTASGKAALAAAHMRSVSVRGAESRKAIAAQLLRGPLMKGI